MRVVVQRSDEMAATSVTYFTCLPSSYLAKLKQISSTYTYTAFTLLGVASFSVTVMTLDRAG